MQTRALQPGQKATCSCADTVQHEPNATAGLQVKCCNSKHKTYTLMHCLRLLRVTHEGARRPVPHCIAHTPSNAGQTGVLLRHPNACRHCRRCGSECIETDCCATCCATCCAMIAGIACSSTATQQKLLTESCVPLCCDANQDRGPATLCTCLTQLHIITLITNQDTVKDQAHSQCSGPARTIAQALCCC